MKKLLYNKCAITNWQTAIPMYFVCPTCGLLATNTDGRLNAYCADLSLHKEPQMMENYFSIEEVRDRYDIIGESNNEA